MLSQLVAYLETFLTDNRKLTLNRILESRTRYISIVLEDLYQPHNASAIMRTCDCFGIQDIHIIENRNTFKSNIEIALGSEQWLSIYKYNHGTETSALTLQSLKEKGYRIIATSSNINDVELENFDIAKGKAAFVFGTELTGVSDSIKSQADEFVKIPMVGFTESLNISVAAAIILQNLTTRLRNSDINWQLDQKEALEIKLKWLRNSLKKSELLEKYFFNNILPKLSNT